MPGQTSPAPKLLWVVVIGLFLAGSPAVAASLELEFAKGVVAFSRGDLPAAESHFQAVLGKQPGHAQAVYYLGQASLGLGKTRKAIGLFRRVLELKPESHAVRLDLAQALVKAGDFKQAETVLVEAARLLPERASVHYYLGFCRYRLGRYRKALAPLERARQMDQGFAAAAGYYLGLAHLKTGQQKEALRQFRRAAARPGAGEAGAYARESLDLLAGPASAPDARDFAVFLSSGVGYDSNVTLNPTDVSGASSGNTFVSLGGNYSPLRSDSSELRLEGALYRSFHLAESAQGFDLTDLALALAFRQVLPSQHRLEVGYGYNLDLLDGGGAAATMLGADDFSVYMQAHEGRAVFSFNLGPGVQTSAGYRFRARRFTDTLKARDSYGHELSVVQDLLLIDQRLHLALALGALYEDGREEAWDLWGPFASLRARLQVQKSLTVWFQAAYHHEDHFHSVQAWDPERQRVDNLWSLGAGFTADIMEELSLGVSYRYLKNRSLDELTYQRHLVSTALMVRFP